MTLHIVSWTLLRESQYFPSKVSQLKQGETSQRLLYVIMIVCQFAEQLYNVNKKASVYLTRLCYSDASELKIIDVKSHIDFEHSDEITNGSQFGPVCRST